MELIVVVPTNIYGLLVKQQVIANAQLLVGLLRIIVIVFNALVAILMLEHL